jgi:hypothetical protein
VQAGLELMILLPVPLWCWDYRCVPPHSVSCMSLKFSSGVLSEEAITKGSVSPTILCQWGLCAFHSH